MARIHLHELPGDKRAGELARLVEDLYRERRRIVIWVADEDRLQILDDYLWTYHKLAFLPHRVWRGGAMPQDESVLLVSDPEETEGFDVLVIGDGLPPADWAARFQDVHDLIPSGDAGAARREFWDRWQADQRTGDDRS